MSREDKKVTKNLITEAELREQIRDLSKIFGWKFWFCWTSIHSPKGMTDLILVRPPRIVFAELKRDSGKLTESQGEWALLLKACPGVEYYCWRPNEFERILEILK